MIIIRYISVGIVSISFIFLGWNVYHSNEETQVEILSHIINIDVTVIGFLITLIGIIAAIRNIELVNNYMKDHGRKFKNILFFTVFSGMLTIILILIKMSLIYTCLNIFLLVGILILQGAFFISCMFIIINMLDMIFKETDKPINEKDVYK